MAQEILSDARLASLEVTNGTYFNLIRLRGVADGIDLQDSATVAQLSALSTIVGNLPSGGGGVSSITAGLGISVGGTASVPIISNTGILYVSSGSGIIVDSTIANTPVIINNGVRSLSAAAGTPLTIGGTAQAPILTNTGVSSVTAGTGITLGGTTQAPIINNSGVSSVSVASGTALTIGGTTQGPILTNTGVSSITAGTGITIGGTTQAPTITNNGILTINNTDGYIGVTTVGGTATLALNGVQTISSFNSTIGITGTTTKPVLQARVGGDAVADVNFRNLYQIQRATNINTQGNLSLINIDGATNGYALKTVNATTTVGVTRCVLQPNGTEVVSTSGIMYDEINYAPAAPCLASGFNANGLDGTLAQGGTLPAPVTPPFPPIPVPVPTLIATQTLTLTSSTFPCNYNRYLGLLGHITLQFSSSQPISWTLQYSKNGGTPKILNGAIYNTQNAYISPPLNGVTYYEGVNANAETFKIGDTVKFFVYASNLGSATTLVTAPPGFSAIISPLAV